ncbi:copper amine oxidase N-terminal domain-containing protein [Saccharibacillus brassicae]|uniref:Copper amine oxidase N-terminal domain-containing protein n=1 Tax=Saccharibacillus brassicae TaxID=2583377 RepID=A0A4Y6UX31_SACBS|nr:copper amine oxidase N-terminal domain-containing protein [Saccharibacillus brassicae]QDH21694.1 copper amine oxidase N-terminal domain-containing protein [Saccharibacillus brassicae]
MKLKSRLTVLLTIVMVSAFSFGISSADASAAAVVPVHLKVGKYSILYTQPAPPFIDRARRVQVPLRSIEDLLGGKVKYDAAAKTAEVEWVGHIFRVEIGSQTAQIDGKTVQMDTTPVLKNQAMFLPLRFFLDATEVKWRWDQASQQLVLADDRVVKGKPFEEFDMHDTASVKNENALIIQSYSIAGNRLTLTALNVSGHTIPAEKADIQPHMHYNYGQYSVDSYNRPSYPPLKKVPDEATVEKKMEVDIKDMDYMITVGRELK